MDHEMHESEEQQIRAPEGVALALTDVAVEKVKEVIAREGLSHLVRGPFVAKSSRRLAI